MATKIIFGLGNPGEEYATTRHNTGFIVLDQLAKDLDVSADDWRQHGAGALVAKSKVGKHTVLLVKPTKFMNNSGKVAKELVGKTKPKDILIIYDDKDLPLGSLRIRKMGSDGGHKGLGGILRLLKTEDIGRLRVGVGPRKGGIKDIIKYILTPFPAPDVVIMKKTAKTASKAAQTFIDEGIDMTMNSWN